MARRHHVIVALLSAVALLVSCRREREPERTAAAAAEPLRCPDSRWQRAASRDSTLAFCLPPDFRRVKQTGLWTRVAGPDTAPPPFVGEDWVSIAHVPDAEVHATDTPWPPSLLRDTSWRCVDCFAAADYAVHWDSVGARIVRVETARVTGGFTGERDAPAVLAAWPTAEGDWVLVQGRARSAAALGELRRILRTIRVRRRARAAT